MKKSTRNLLIIFIIILFIVCLFSFNVNGIRRLYNRSGFPRFMTSREIGIGIDDSVEEAEADYAYAVAETQAFGGFTTNGSMSLKKMAVEAPASAAGEDGATTKERKLVKNISINCETKDFDNAYKTIIGQVEKYEAIVDNQSLNNGSIGSKNQRRSCNFTIRVPEEKLDSFINDATKGLNTTYKYESVEDITDNYNDTLARLETYKEEEKKLNELIKKADKVDDMVNIENRLSDVRYNIQSIEKRIANMDKTVDYSTINLNVQEVIILTKPKDVTPTKDSIMAAFKKNLEDTKIFVKNAGIYIFTHLPAIGLAFIIAIILLIILIIIVNASDGAARRKERREEKKELKRELKDKKNVKAEKEIEEVKEKKDIVETKENIKNVEEKANDSDDNEVEVEIVEMKSETPRVTIEEDTVVEKKEVEDKDMDITEPDVKESNDKNDDDPYTMDLDFTI